MNDRVLVTAHYLSLLRKEVDSEKELKQRYPPHMLKTVLAKTDYPEVIGAGIKFTVPITRFKYSQMAYLIVLLENYERGNLPFEGLISDQPAQIIELLNLVQLIKIEHRTKAEKK